MSSPSATNGKPDDPQPVLPDSSQSFPKSRRLLRRADFQRVYNEGLKLVGPYFLLFALRRDEGGSCRIGLTASRKAGKAVVRNRAKRLLREAARRNWEQMPPGCDCVFHVRTRMRDAEFAHVEADLRRMMAKARATLKVE